MKTFVCSDHHFGHRGIITFRDYDGNLIRPFSSYEEMEDEIVKRHNEVVGHGDKVYFLGDVVKNKKDLRVIEKMNGRKTLIMGNHDVFNAKDYLKVFDNVRGVRVMQRKSGGRIVLSHFPIEARSMCKIDYNLHGHLHANVVSGSGCDEKYVNVCLEKTDFRPIDINRFLL